MTNNYLHNKIFLFILNIQGKSLVAHCVRNEHVVSKS